MLTRVSERITAGQPVKIVLYGDSITEVGRSATYFGGASCAAMNWGQQLGALLNMAFPGMQFVVEHFGIGGQNSYEGLGRLDGLAPYEPDLVLVAFGANDAGWHYLPPESTRTALAFLAAGIRDRYAADVLMVIPGMDNPRQSRMFHGEDTLAAIRQAARDTGVDTADVRNAVLDATNNGRNWTDYHFAEQDCHPNDRGHALWAAAVRDAIMAHVEVRVG